MPSVDAFNRRNPSLVIYVNNKQQRLDETLSQHYLAVVDSLSTRINSEHSEKRIMPLLIQRAVAESVTQNYDAALSDLNTVLESDSTSVLALWHKAYCQSMANEFSNATVLSNSTVEKTGLIMI